MRSVNSSSEALEKFDSSHLPVMPVCELTELHGQITAIHKYLKQRNVDLDRQNQAAECRLRIERQLGTILTETVVPRGNHGGVVGATKSLPEGITKKQSFRWRRESGVPEAAFELWIADTRAAGGEITSAGLLALWAELYDDVAAKAQEVDLIFPRDRIIDTAFAHYRQTGFPYRSVPIHVAMQDVNRLAAITPSKLLTTTVGCVVADSYHPHRFRATSGGHPSVVERFHSDKHLRRALEHELVPGRSIPSGFFSGLATVSGTAPCSNFRPGVASHYYRRFCPSGGVVLDTCAGYGGRLVGFLASRRGGSYIGTRSEECGVLDATACKNWAPD